MPTEVGSKWHINSLILLFPNLLSRYNLLMEILYPHVVLPRYKTVQAAVASFPVHLASLATVLHKSPHLLTMPHV